MGRASKLPIESRNDGHFIDVLDTVFKKTMMRSSFQQPGEMMKIHSFLKDGQGSLL